MTLLLPQYKASVAASCGFAALAALAVFASTSFVAAAFAAAPVPPPFFPSPNAAANSHVPAVLSAQQFVQVRCQAEGQTQYFEGQGQVYANFPAEPMRPLFTFSGLDITRCVRNKRGGWTLESRELGYYLDSATRAPLGEWQNPFTHEVVNVMHIANPLLQLDLPPQIPVRSQGELSVVTLELPLAVPSPTDSNQRLAPYIAAGTVRSFVSYSYVFNAAAVNGTPSTPDTPGDAAIAGPSAKGAVGLTYFEVGPWRPWMKMGALPGQMVFSIASHRVAHFQDLSPLFQKEINERLPLYKEAPVCKTTLAGGSTFLDFAQSFDAYLRGEKFPLPAPLRAEPCEE